MQALTRCSCQKQMTGLLEYDAASPSPEPNTKAPLLLVLYRFSAFRTHGPSSNQVTPVHRGRSRAIVALELSGAAEAIYLVDLATMPRRAQRSSTSAGATR
jgi:hypothetical protein